MDCLCVAGCEPGKGDVEFCQCVFDVLMFGWLGRGGCGWERVTPTTIAEGESFKGKRNMKRKGVEGGEIKGMGGETLGERSRREVGREKGKETGRIEKDRTKTRLNSRDNSTNKSYIQHDFSMNESARRMIRVTQNWSIRGVATLRTTLRRIQRSRLTGLQAINSH